MVTTTITPTTQGSMKQKIRLRSLVISEHPLPSRVVLILRRAQAQPTPQPGTDQTTSTMTSTLTGYTNGSAGHAGFGNGVAIEHAGPGFSKVEPARNV